MVQTFGPSRPLWDRSDEKLRTQVNVAHPCPQEPQISHGDRQTRVDSVTSVAIQAIHGAAETQRATPSPRLEEVLEVTPRWGSGRRSQVMNGVTPEPLSQLSLNQPDSLVLRPQPALWDGSCPIMQEKKLRCRVNSVIRQGTWRESEPRASNVITLGQDRVNCSGCLSLLLSANPHQVPERKPGLLPRPWKAPFAGGFSPAKGHTFTGPRPKAVRVDHSPWGTDTPPSPHVCDR